MNGKVIFFDYPDARDNLLPFTYLRPIADLRCGILTIAEKWQKILSIPETGYLTAFYLQNKYALSTKAGDNFYINGSLLPNPIVTDAIKSLSVNEALYWNDFLCALRTDKKLDTYATLVGFAEKAKTVMLTASPVSLQYPWDIFRHNAAAINSDFSLLTQGRYSAPIHDRHTIVYGRERIFVEEGAQVKAAILNATSGVIYIGKNVKIKEGAIISGNHALCEGATVNMGAKLKGDSTIGPYCKVGGEISNSVFLGYANKGHDGFLGNSVVGEWCNIGADTNSSNLKNNYSQVRVWHYPTKNYYPTGLQFCGLLMGDHAKCGINTMFNTGTVVGVSANIFGSDFPPTFVPSFTWGGGANFVTADFSKMCQVAERVMQRRKVAFTDIDKNILDHVFETSEELRKPFLTC